jgi:hypothetical protein
LLAHGMPGATLAPGVEQSAESPTLSIDGRTVSVPVEVADVLLGGWKAS